MDRKPQCFNERSIGDSFFFHYLFSRIKAMFNPFNIENVGIYQSVVDGFNPYENIAYGHKWF